jgi:hypothetical protein
MIYAAHVLGCVVFAILGVVMVKLGIEWGSWLTIIAIADFSLTSYSEKSKPTKESSVEEGKQ